MSLRRIAAAGHGAGRYLSVVGVFEDLIQGDVEGSGDLEGGFERRA